MPSTRPVLLLALVLAFLSVASLVAAAPSKPVSNEAGVDEPLPVGTTPPGVSVANGAALRILPLGDSITYGVGSLSGNGYRQKLRHLLSADTVSFAGTQYAGRMKDGWNEGYPTRDIAYIHLMAMPALAQEPNIVLLMAGTNDMVPSPWVNPFGTDATLAGERLGMLIDDVTARLPDAVVLVAQLTSIYGSSQFADNVAAYNAVIPKVVDARSINGQGDKKVALVSMERVQGFEYLSTDGLHPNDAGYTLMADVWYQALHEMPEGWVVPPSTPEPTLHRAAVQPGGLVDVGLPLAVPVRDSWVPAAGPGPRLP